MIGSSRTRMGVSRAAAAACCLSAALALARARLREGFKAGNRLVVCRGVLASMLKVGKLGSGLACQERRAVTPRCAACVASVLTGGVLSASADRTVGWAGGELVWGRKICTITWLITR